MLWAPGQPAEAAWLLDEAQAVLQGYGSAPGDVRAQLEISLKSVEQLLAQAGMTKKNILTLRFYTTDMEGFMANYDVYANWIAESGVRPPQSLLGVAALALEGMVVEVEVLAGR